MFWKSGNICLNLSLFPFFSGIRMYVCIYSYNVHMWLYCICFPLHYVLLEKWLLGADEGAVFSLACRALRSSACSGGWVVIVCGVKRNDNHHVGSRDVVPRPLDADMSFNFAHVKVE